MESWTVFDDGKMMTIKVALLQLEKEYSISYSEEMEWLNNLKRRE